MSCPQPARIGSGVITSRSSMDPGRGSGLAGLAQRAAVVDGRLDITSPPGGPTQVTVELPLHT
jgi:signal transduction histidine kinase